MKPVTKKSKIWQHPLVRRLVIGAVWAATLFGLAIPAWRHSMVNQREIETLQGDLAAMDQWTVAGMWLERSVAERAPAVDQVWNRLFPAQREREELFLELARIADLSGVRHFDLAEMQSDGMPGGEVWQDGSSMDGGMGGDMSGGMGDGPGEYVEEDMAGGVMEIELPTVEMDSYRVKARFESDYGGTARFLGGLQTIQRAVGLHSLIARPLGEAIQVDMELDIYVSQSTES